MSINFEFTPIVSQQTDTVVVTIDKDKNFYPAAKSLDAESDGWLSHCLEKRNNFKATAGQALSVPMQKGADQSRTVLFSLGDVSELTLTSAEELGGKLYKSLKGLGVACASVLLDADDALECGTAMLASHMAYGALLASYEYNEYKSQKDEEGDNVALSSIEFVLDDEAAAQAEFEILDALSEGVYLARDLINQPPNDLHPVSYAQIIKDEMKGLKVDIEVIDEKKMQKLGMGAILNVGKGSAEDRQPRMVIMRYYGAGKPTKKQLENEENRPLCFVGKGVTFDTGGISLKPGAEMDLMKMDMGGSAVVVGLMKALAKRKAKVNVVAAVGLAENMPSDKAYRPADVITSYAGKTIEILNTDAEGRLVLADTLTYVQEKDKPKMIIDLATLTGAMMVALGFEYSGVFVNDDELWGKIESSSAKTGEKLWRMPLDEAYRKEVESDIADLKNLGNLGRYGGACSAAGFLEHFIDEGQSWAHIDIAGTAWAKSSKTLVPKGGTGFGVRALHEMVRDFYEK